MRRMMMVSLLTSTFLAAGCMPPWFVVRQATPNPLLGQSQFTLHPIDFQSLMVGDKSQGAYLGGKDPEQRAGWQADLVAMNQIFTSRVASTPGLQVAPAYPHSTGFSIVPRIVFIEPGFFAGIVSAPTQVRMVLQIVNGGRWSTRFTSRSRSRPIL